MVQNNSFSIARARSTHIKDERTKFRAWLSSFIIFLMQILKTTLECSPISSLFSQESVIESQNDSLSSKLSSKTELCYEEKMFKENM